MDPKSATICFNESNYFLEIYLDPFNKRVRVDDYRGHLSLLLEKAEEVAHKHQVEKLTIKARREDLFSLFEKGFLPEAVVDRYFSGSDAYFFSKFYTADRKKNDHWLTEDGIIRTIYQLKSPMEKGYPPKEYEIKLADESHAVGLSELYRQVFQIYPTPLHDYQYVKKTIREGTIYYLFLHQGKIVSAASAEINPVYKNAELTDCATLPEHRQYGLLKILLRALEGELKQRGIYCSYSIARALSFEMNAALFQLEYQYRGRFMNNCFIYDKLEDMNMWVKNLATAKNPALSDHHSAPNSQ